MLFGEPKVAKQLPQWLRNDRNLLARCDSAETAEHLKAQIQVLVDRPENIAKFDDIEQRLVEKGLLLPLDCGKYLEQKGGCAKMPKNGFAWKRCKIWMINYVFNIKHFFSILLRNEMISHNNYRGI